MVRRKLTEKEKMVLSLLEINAGNVKLTCKKANISRAVFYQKMDSNCVFRNGVEDVREGLIDFVESQLYLNIKKGKEISTIFFLKTKGKKRGYVESQEVQHSGSFIPPKINVQIVKNS